MTPNNPIRFTVTEYKPLLKNTLLGVFTLKLEPIGLTISDCLLHQKGDRMWCAFPAKPYTDKQGKITYTKILDFPDRETWDKFQEVIIPRVRSFAKI